MRLWYEVNAGGIIGDFFLLFKPFALAVVCHGLRVLVGSFSGVGRVQQ